MTKTLRRWAEAIAQNVLATILIAAGVALIGYLLTDAGNSLTVRVWWLAVAVAVLLMLFVWLVWLTAHVRRLRRASADGPAAGVAAPPHPHQMLLDRIDAMIPQLESYEDHEPVSWQTGQTYNDLMQEARAVDQRLNLRQLPVATEVRMYSGSSTTDPSPRELAGGLRQARVYVARAES